MSGKLLEISDLSVGFTTSAGRVGALSRVSLSLDEGETLGVVGESGSGKTTAALAAIGLMSSNARIEAGRIVFAGHDLTGASRRTMRPLRGAAMSMIFQHPRAALNPVRRIGQQIVDAIRAHRRVSPAAARAQAVDLLRAVQFRDPERGLDAYAHELSGGMCQRAMIAIAIACEPRLLIADEPTTGLDATTQRAVMTVLVDLIRARGMAMLLITHDLGLAARYCDRISVMRQGRVVETGRTADLFRSPRDAYTRRLIAATPLRDTRLDDLVAASAAPALPASAAPRHIPGHGHVLEVRDLRKTFGHKVAVDGISFTLDPGGSLGLVGESGSGKSTTSRILCRLLDQTAGEVIFEGEDIGGIPVRDCHRSPWRRRIQLVFQDPTDSIYPRFTAAQSIADPLRRLLRLRGAALHRRVGEAADAVGLEPGLLGRLPHQLSGGQKARVGIARAISVEPSLLILDEPTAALDVSVQAVILTLLERLKRQLGMSYVFVSHDLNVVKMMCDHTIVLRAGQIVEQADSRTLFESPSHAYTRELLDAVPHLSFEPTRP